MLVLRMIVILKINNRVTVVFRLILTLPCPIGNNNIFSDVLFVWYKIVLISYINVLVYFQKKDTYRAFNKI